MNDDFGTFSYGGEKKDSGKETGKNAENAGTGAPKKRWTPEPYKESVYAAPNYARTDYSRQDYLKPSESRFAPGGAQPVYPGTAGTQYPGAQPERLYPQSTQPQGPASPFAGADTQNNASQYAGDKTPQRKNAEKTPGSNPPSRPEKKDSFARKLLLTALLGLVFGLIGGGAFIGINKAFGDSDKDTGSTSISADNSGNTETGSTQATLVTGDQIKTQDTVSGDNNTTTINYDVAEIVKKAQPSIVSITTRVTTQYQYFYQQFEQESTGAGSGIIIGETKDKLYIATNYHVIEGAKEINVGFNDGTILKANVTGADKSNDVAVVEIPIETIPQSTADAISVAVPGDSDKLQVGEPAIAIGNALGYGQSVTVGYISALNRSISGNEGSYIQTDAAINPGNSGGALINSKGEVIGINSVKYVDNKVEGMGFSIPINRAMTIIDGLISGRTSGSVYIGITGATINSDYSQIYGFPEGVYVKSITANGPAARGGIHEGDILVSLEGKKVSTMDEFKELLQNYPAGTEVKIELYRANSMGRYEKTTVKVVTAEE